MCQGSCPQSVFEPERTIPDSAKDIACTVEIAMSIARFLQSKDYEVKEYVGRTSDKADGENDGQHKGAEYEKTEIQLGRYGHDIIGAGAGLFRICGI